MTKLASESQREDLTNSPQESQESTNLMSKASLIRRIRRSRDARARFVDSNVDKKLAFQIRSLRGDRSQGEMHEITGLKQQVISRLENPSYGKASLTTLKRIAAACDVALLVEFVPFSQLINRVSGTPYMERGNSPETMNVTTFEQEERAGAYDVQDSQIKLLIFQGDLKKKESPASNLKWLDEQVNIESDAAREAAMGRKKPSKSDASKEKLLLSPPDQRWAFAGGGN